MKLDKALALIAKHAGLDYVELCEFADEDQQGGRNAGYDGWSIDADEGKLLYALVRALRPAQVVEIGVRMGASTAHLLAALDANGTGRLDSYDLEAAPLTQHPAWAFHQGDALAADFPPAELVFEDSGHGLDYSLALFERLKFARVLVTHDTLMTSAHGDFHVREAFETTFPNGLVFALDGCERGLGVWVNPEWAIAEREAQAAYDAQQITPDKPAAKKPAPRPQAKRTARK